MRQHITMHKRLSRYGYWCCGRDDQTQVLVAPTAYSIVWTVPRLCFPERLHQRAPEAVLSTVRVPLVVLLHPCIEIGVTAPVLCTLSCGRQRRRTRAGWCGEPVRKSHWSADAARWCYCGRCSQSPHTVGIRDVAANRRILFPNQ
jgi:hypothetical protein